MLRQRLDRFEPIVFAVLRVLSGFMFTLHGLQKVFGMFERASAA